MFDWASWVRIKSANTPPRRKKNSEHTPTVKPMRLWSVLVSAPSHPVMRETRARGAAATLTAPPPRGSEPTRRTPRG